MFKKVLIANRGEIAVRILRGCHELGMSVVAIFSEQDRGALHVRYADEAYLLGSGSSEETYLAEDKVLEIARKAKVDAIHPGYGFLAESRDFAEKCQKQGITFIGPRGESLEIMGDKMRTKEIMSEAQIPVIPWSPCPSDDDGVLSSAARLGYPVLIKAVKGGGGKGIRRVDRAEEILQALQLARSEAMASFGSEAVYLEKYVDQARHIEFQILADNHGNIIHLFDRECSIQRRFQKILEECPSPFLDDTTRLRMAGAALSAAIAAHYSGAGTVEFLIDGKKNFYFLELNARLQVEHPVTEMVTRVDIVKAQIRVAAGERLSLAQQDVQPVGSSIVCRIYAEDPENNFFPSTGRIKRLQIPGGPWVRVDLGIYEGYTIPIFYDPIIAKVIVWGSHRGEAILRMNRVLQELVIKGVKTTIPFHRWLVNNERFIRGDFNTNFLKEEYFERKRKGGDDSQDEVACMAAGIRSYQRERKEARSDYKIKTEGRVCSMEVEFLEDRQYRIIFNGSERLVDVLEISENLYSLICDGRSYEVDMDEEGDRFEISIKGKNYRWEILPPEREGPFPIVTEKTGPPSGEEVITSPMTCNVVRVMVGRGEKVQTDQLLIVAEAMKMEMPITSPIDGSVKEILVKEGQTVDMGAELLILLPTESKATAA